MRVTRSRELVAAARRRWWRALRRSAARRSTGSRRPGRPGAASAAVGLRGDAAIVEVAQANPTDGYRMVAALPPRGSAGR